MEREFLEKQGLNADQITAIMTQYGKDVNNVKAKYDAKVSDLTSKVDSLNEQVSDRDKQIKDLGSAAKDNADLKAKFDEAKKTIAENDKKNQAELLSQRKNFAVQEALTRAGAYNNKAVMALIDMDKVSVDDKGNILHVDDVVADAQKAFPQGFKPQKDEKEDAKPVPHIFPTGNNNSDVKQPSEMSLDDQMKLYHENPSRWRKLFEK